MKHLILLLLIPLFACSHEHPLTDHQHEHILIEHDHDPQFKYPETLDFAYIVGIDPPMTGEGIWKSGRLVNSTVFGGDVVQVVTISFSKPPQNLTITDVPDPVGLPVTPLRGSGRTTHRDAATNINRVSLYAECSDPEHAGGIAVQLDWDTGSALLRYRCPNK